MAQLRCARSWRAAGYDMSRGTPTRSRRYRAHAAVASRPAASPARTSAANALSSGVGASSSSQPATWRSSASTSASISPSAGWAYGSARGAWKRLAPARPAPRSAKRVTGAWLAISLCAASCAAPGSSCAQPGCSTSASCSESPMARSGSRHAPPSPSMDAWYCACSPAGTPSPYCGGMSFTCVYQSDLVARYAGIASNASNQRSSAGQRGPPPSGRVRPRTTRPFQYGTDAAIRSTCETYCRSTSDGRSPPSSHGPSVCASAASTSSSARSNPAAADSPGRKVSWHQRPKSWRSSLSSALARSSVAPSFGSSAGASGNARSSSCMMRSDSVCSSPSSSMAGSSPPGTLRRKSAGLSPYERMLISSTRYGTCFSSSCSHTFWQYGHHAAWSR
mmetsp:Transcript_8526/g.22030  ORF Transcript_8526/g.22030 Transcript_8526/m.22030 type:complete len:392 (+) Transcript_8526:114-1289(+)